MDFTKFYLGNKKHIVFGILILSSILIQILIVRNFLILEFSTFIVIFSLFPLYIAIIINWKTKIYSYIRAKNQEDYLRNVKKRDWWIDLSLGRGSYKKSSTLLASLFLITYLTLYDAIFSVFTNLIIIALRTIFYINLVLVAYYFPDNEEVKLWHDIRENTNLRLKSSQYKFNRISKRIVIVLFSILIITELIVILTIYLLNLSILNNYNFLLFIGFLLTINCIISLIFLGSYKMKNYINIDLKKKVQVSKKRINLKLITYISMVVVLFIFQWNIWLFYTKELFSISFYSIFLIISIIFLVYTTFIQMISFYKILSLF